MLLLGVVGVVVRPALLAAAAGIWPKAKEVWGID